MIIGKPMPMTKVNRLAARLRNKTHTRRVCPVQPLTPKSVLRKLIDTTDREELKYRGYYYWVEFNDLCEVKDTQSAYFKPRYQVGEIFYVPEPYQMKKWAVKRNYNQLVVVYLDDGIAEEAHLTRPELEKFNARTNPYMETQARFMYKSLARDFYKILRVWVERTQDITRTDIRAEGLICPKELGSDDLEYNYKNWYADKWKELWNSINKARGYGWDKNTWNFAYEFERIEK